MAPWKISQKVHCWADSTMDSVPAIWRDSYVVNLIASKGTTTPALARVPHVSARPRKRRRLGETGSTNMDTMLKIELPDEIWKHAFTFLMPEDVGRSVPLTCRRFLRLALSLDVKAAVLRSSFGVRFCSPDSEMQPMISLAARVLAGSALVQIARPLTAWPMLAATATLSEVGRVFSLLGPAYARGYAELSMTESKLRGWNVAIEGTTKRFTVDGFPLSICLSLNSQSSPSGFRPLHVSLPMHGGSCPQPPLESSRFQKNVSGMRWIRRARFMLKPFVVLPGGQSVELASAPLETDFWGHAVSNLACWNGSSWRQATSRLMPIAPMLRPGSTLCLAFGIRKVSEKWSPVTSPSHPSLRFATIERARLATLRPPPMSRLMRRYEGQGLASLASITVPCLPPTTRGSRAVVDARRAAAISAARRPR